MCARRYYSYRTGRRSYLTFERFRRVVIALIRSLEDRGYFQEAFGFTCVDLGFVPGRLGKRLDEYVLQELRIEAWPFDKYPESYDEKDIFDLIEFVFDYISAPVDGWEHDYADCGWHYEVFYKEGGQQEFRQAINKHLRDYGNGFELSETGEILALVDPGLDTLISAELPRHDPNNVEKRVEDAIMKFRRSRASLSERRDAVRDLADVLEFLRPQAKNLLPNKDESDLFQIANRFGIRHHKADQQTGYDQVIWLSWMFHYYLATIHALVRLIEKHQDDE